MAQTFFGGGVPAAAQGADRPPGPPAAGLRANAASGPPARRSADGGPGGRPGRPLEGSPACFT